MKLTPEQEALWLDNARANVSAAQSNELAVGCCEMADTLRRQRDAALLRVALLPDYIREAVDEIERQARVKICGECEAAQRAFADGEKSRQPEIDQLKARVVELEQQIAYEHKTYLGCGTFDEVTKLQSDSAELAELKAALEWLARYADKLELSIFKDDGGVGIIKTFDHHFRGYGSSAAASLIAFARKLGWPGVEKKNGS